MFPLLDLKGNYHYWIAFSEGSSKWKVDMGEMGVMTSNPRHGFDVNVGRPGSKLPHCQPCPERILDLFSWFSGGVFPLAH